MRNLMAFFCLFVQLGADPLTPLRCTFPTDTFLPLSDTAVSGTKTTHILKTIIARYPKILTPGSTAAYAASSDLLSKFDIVDQKVGFRPSRIGGVRVEVEHGRKDFFL